jgi:hypothetical protein
MVRSEHEGTVAQRGHHEPITEPMDRHWEQVWKEVANGYRPEASTDPLLAPLPAADSVQPVVEAQTEPVSG